MRSLRDWDKYLREQEKTVKQAAKPKPSEQIPAATVEEAKQRIDTSGPKSGAIIAVPADTPAQAGQADPYKMPEIEEFVPAVSEPRPIPKSTEEGVSEARPVKTAQAPDREAAQRDLFEAPKKKLRPTRPSPRRPRTARTSKPRSGNGSPPPGLAHLSPSVMEFLARDAGKAAEKYYTRGFGESRHELIERLLDPPLTLEETARLLGVCPTTVRRYTNKGVLSHFRTAGNQRRFRLSDIVAFVESHLLAQGPSPGQDPVPAADERTAEAPAPKRRRTEASPQKTRTPKRARSTPALKKAPARKRTSEVAKPSR